MDHLRLLTQYKLFQSWIDEEKESLSYLIEMYFDDYYNYRINYYTRSLMLYGIMIEDRYTW